MSRKVLFISVASLLFTSALFQLTVFSSLKNKIDDSLFYFRGPLLDRGREVVIVALDEASLQKMGDWPWPRSLLAGLIAKIKQGGPKVIGIDLLLDLPSKGANADLEHRKLAEVFSVAPVCVLPVVVKEEISGGIQETLFKPVDIFLTSHTKTGVVNILPDPADKITREFKVLYDRSNLSFPLEVCLAYLGRSANDIEVNDSIIKFGSYSIPVHNLRVRINYKCAKIDKFSAGDVMEPFFDPAFFFKGKIVLLGRTDLASKDFVNTPVPSGTVFETLSMAGVEVWKETIDTILQKNFLSGVPPFIIFLIAAAVSLAICGVTVYSNKGGAVVSVFLTGLCGFSFYYVFLKHNIILPLLYLAAVCGVSYAFSFLYNFIVTHREKRMITAAFKSYISPHVLQNILSQKVDLTVGGKRKNLTMLFTDIKGFTGFSDTHEPEEVLNFLKAFFPEMNKVIMEHNGLIDKLLGDGILAFFGDFTDSDSHAGDAVRAAIEMQGKVPDLKKRLGFDFQIRIGIHTGEVTVGNVGSREHLDYTVIGSNVNLAQRLESNCEPGRVMISDVTYQMVKDAIEITDAREIPVKGFAKPVKVCTVLGLKDTVE
jgi:adenylate cyclase